MEQIRKIVSWCWNVKERLVLGLMVILLAYRVYALVYPPTSDTGEEKPIPRMPGSTMVGSIQVNPPPPPPLDDVEPVTRLVRNPWDQYSPPRAINSSRDTSDDEGDDGKVRLLRIQSVGKDKDGNPKYKAQIKTATTRKMVSEGDPFESYQLLKIDPDNKCVEIYSENINGPIERCIE